jgi:Domain of unknown function (DUF4389)
MESDQENKVIRLIYVILFYCIYSLSELALVVIAFVQTFLNIFNGAPNENLQIFGANLAVYVKEITEYVSYVHDEKPFPFSDWPNVQQKDVSK